MATEEQALDHIRSEMYARDLSAGDVARILAAKGVRFSSETLSRNLRSGHLTDLVREGVALAFGWPSNWTDDLPPLSQADPAKRLGAGDEIMRRLDALEGLVAELLLGQERTLAGQEHGFGKLDEVLDLLRAAPGRRRAAQ